MKKKWDGTYTGEVLGIQIGVLPGIAPGPTETHSPRPEPVPDLFLNVRYQGRDRPGYQRVALGIRDVSLDACIRGLMAHPPGCVIKYRRVRPGEYVIQQREASRASLGDTHPELAQQVEAEKETKAREYLALAEKDAKAVATKKKTTKKTTKSKKDAEAEAVA